MKYEEEKRTGSDDEVMREAETACRVEKKTIEDFYAMPEDWRGELIDGVLYDVGMPRMIHQKLAWEIGRQMEAYVDEHRGDCFVMPLPIDVQLDRDEYTMVEPDITVTCDREKIRERVIYGEPDLVVEILSPSTARKDRFLKLMKYMNAGVREYWIVDPRTRTVMVYERDALVVPMTYTFGDTVPVGIWDGECRVDFPRIMERVGFLFDVPK